MKRFVAAGFLLMLSATAFAQQEMRADLDDLDEYRDVPQGLMMPQGQAQGAAPSMAADGDARMQVGYGTTMQLYKSGRFAEALASLKPLVAAGHHGAEELMGIMYEQGNGVEKDEKRAVELLTLAAEAARPLAQHHLGVLYFQGRGVEADPVQALMWLHLAIAHYPEGAEKERAMHDRDALYVQMTRLDKDKALKMARSWLEKRNASHLLDLQ